MRKVSVIFMVAMVVLTFSSCKSKLEKLETVVFSDDFNYDTKGVVQATELMDLYTRKAEADPKAAKAPAYMFKAAELAMNLEKTQKALDLYNKIIYTYPEYEKAPECLFLMAFIYENNLQNYGKAKELYEQFLKQYPNHEFADDAAFSLQNLGKSPEDLMREFESKNQGQEVL
jgi:tetratricopeptide (TPR) repeat protein